MADTHHRGIGLSFPERRDAWVTAGRGTATSAPALSGGIVAGGGSTSIPRNIPAQSSSPALHGERGESRALHQHRPQALTWQPRLPLSQAEIEGERGSACWHCPSLALPEPSAVPLNQGTLGEVLTMAN